MQTRKTGPTIASKLARQGVRLTRQRRALLEVIESSSGHLHASDFLEIARGRDERIDRATVYRTLALLKEHGLIEELDLLHLDGFEHHYELPKGGTHVHVGCTRCGRVMEVESDLIPRLRSEVEAMTGCAISSVRVEVSAVCPECLLGSRDCLPHSSPDG